MTIEQIQWLAQEMNGGRAYGCVTLLAKKLGVRTFTVHRWYSGKPIPKSMQILLRYVEAEHIRIRDAS